MTGESQPDHSVAEAPGEWTSFRERRYFPELDGLRALSIFIVVAFHMRTPLWSFLNGPLGVTLFFVLSGFLITTLSLREERSRGVLCFSAFTIRRSFRIFPAYYLTLAFYCLLIFGLNLRPDRYQGLKQVLPYYLTYFQEIPHYQGLQDETIPFSQAWSLGIEEKFYLVWPVLAFWLWRGWKAVRWVGALALALLFASAPALESVGYGVLGLILAPYSAILVGCLVAFWLDDPGWFRRLSILGRPVCFWLVVAVLVGLHLTIFPERAFPHACYIFVAGLFLICLLIAPNPIRRFLSWSPLVFIGRLSYGVYLLHVLVYNAVEKLLKPAQGRVMLDILALGLTFGLSLLLAYGLAVLIERPGIAIGRKLSSRVLEYHAIRRGHLAAATRGSS